MPRLVQANSPLQLRELTVELTDRSGFCHLPYRCHRLGPAPRRTLFRPHKNFGIPQSYRSSPPRFLLTPTKRGTEKKLTILPPIFDSQEGRQYG